MNQEDNVNYSPLPESDLRFMEDVFLKYTIPKDILFMMILDFRNTRRNPFSSATVTDQHDINTKENERVSLFESRVLEIIIRTEAGDVTFDRSDKHFKYFQQAFKSLASDYRQYLPRNHNEVLETLLDGDVFLLNHMLMQHTNLIASHRHQLIGLFMLHFGVDKRVSIKTEQQWTDNPTSDQDYKHYLEKFVKSRLRFNSKRFSM
jgi:hypothetical protein